MVVALFALAGCIPPDGGGGDTQPVDARVLLGSNGVVSVPADTNGFSTGVFDITDQLPSFTPASAEIRVSAADLTATDPADPATPPTTKASITFLFDDADAADPCATGTPTETLDVEIAAGTTQDITPATLFVDDATLSLLAGGQFSLCLAVGAEMPIEAVLEALTIRLIPPQPPTAGSCADVLALPQVQRAITLLASNGVQFALPPAGSTADITGAYDLEQITTFDPDGSDNGDTFTGSVSLENQTDTAIQRTGFGASLGFFLQGDATTVGLCTLASTGSGSCSQTIARLERVTVDRDTGNLDGSFLSVVVARQATTDPTCGPVGDFIFGSLTLTATDTAPVLLQRAGKVALPDGFVPDLMVLPPEGGDGTVTDQASATALHFQTVEPFDTTPITLPVNLSTAGFSALGISTDGSRLVVVTDLPDATATYDNNTLELIRTTVATSADYIGGRVDFSPDASRVYVPTTDPQFADRVTVLRTDDSPFADEVRRLLTPQGRVPVQARISPDGGQLAMLLEVDAPIGLAAELVLVNANTGNVLNRTSLTDNAGGTVLATELVYAADGSRVFMAGLGNIVAVQTASPFDVELVDPSGVGDDPIGLALSGDGQVLVAAIDSNMGDIDFAVVDASTLNVLNAQDLAGIALGGALNVVHLGGSRLAAVADFDSNIVAVQTEAPFAASQVLSAADVTDATSLGALSAGADTVTVANLDEPAIYVFTTAGAP